MEDRPTRVLIVDDHVLYREGIRGLIDHWPEFEVIGDVSNGKEAVDFCRKDAPDLVLMDIQMPVMGGVEATGILHDANPDTAIVMLTISATKENLIDSICNGASGYILKDMPARQLRNRLQGVARGEGALSGAATMAVLKELKSLRRKYAFQNDFKEGSDCLADREIQTLRLVAQGLSNEEIGAELYLSAATIKKQLGSIMQKLNLENRVQVAVYAVRAGFAD